MTGPVFESGAPEAHVQFEDGWIYNYRGDHEVGIQITQQEAVNFASILLQYGTGRQSAPAHRLTEPAVDRYFNGGETMADTVARNEKLRASVNDEAHAGLADYGDETFPERLARFAKRSADERSGAVLVEHTAPYRSNVTFLHPEGDDAA